MSFWSEGKRQGTQGRTLRSLSFLSLVFLSKIKETSLNTNNLSTLSGHPKPWKRRGKGNFRKRERERKTKKRQGNRKEIQKAKEEKDRHSDLGDAHFGNKRILNARFVFPTTWSLRSALENPLELPRCLSIGCRSRERWMARHVA